ncbi:MAG: septation protein IspZ [Fibrobacteres bacterium]|nr:septation protein IspZ [Fibrobacterota bacterium]
MNPRTFIRNLLLGFLPILAYIIADEVFTSHYGEHNGTRYALIFAISLGVVQTIIVYVREKRIDKMVLFDTALLLGMGGISLLSGNDLFFKLKPAIAELLVVILLFVVSFFNPKLLLFLMGRMSKGVELTDLHFAAMQKAARGLFVVMALHTALVVFAALSMSKGAWGFISGPLFYIVCGMFFLFTVVSGRLRKNKSIPERKFVYEPRRRIRK